MKQFIAIILTMVICLSLCACGSAGSTPTQPSKEPSKEDAITKYLGTYVCEGFYDDDSEFVPFRDDNPILILEENNVAKVSFIPSSGIGYTFYYTIEEGLLSLTIDSNRDGIPDVGDDIATGAGAISDVDGTTCIIWGGVLDSLGSYYYKKEK